MGKTWDQTEERWVNPDGSSAAPPSSMAGPQPPRLAPWAQYVRLVERGADIGDALWEVEHTRGRPAAQQVTDRLRSLVLAVGAEERVG